MTAADKLYASLCDALEVGSHLMSTTTHVRAQEAKAEYEREKAGQVERDAFDTLPDDYETGDY